MENNEKRAIIAILITVLLIAGYTYFFNPYGDTSKNKTAPAVKNSTVQLKESHKQKILKGVNAVNIHNKQLKSAYNKKKQLITVETDEYTAHISNLDGSLESLMLKKYVFHKHRVELINSQGNYHTLESVFQSKDVENLEQSHIYHANNGNIKIDKKHPSGTLILTKTDGNIKIVKKYTFKNNSYAMNLSINVYRDGKKVNEIFSLYAGPNLGDLEAGRYSHLGAVALVKNKIKKDEKIPQDSGDINWIALESKYFCFAFLPYNKNSIIAGSTNADKDHYIYANFVTPSTVTIFGGPKSKPIMHSVDHHLSRIIRFGMFGFIGKPLLYVLNMLYSILGNYGLAIIVLTFFIRLLFYPLSFKSFKSMKEMSKLQPKLKELKNRYKGKPDQLNKATMELYKQHKVNPFGGCLPVIIQIPVFFALYNVLLNAIELRGAPFYFWIVDLSAKDPYYILPIIMGATMYLQQKLTPTTMDPSQAKIMAFLPLIFTVMFLSFPSGLVIYWATNNILTIIQQVFIDSKILKAKEKNA